MVRTRVSAPGFSVTRSRMQRSTSARGSPFNMATRSRRPASKSISPRMPRSVMAAISGLIPMKSASSSMHSTATMVESMSEISSRLRRPSQGWTQTSRGKCCSVFQAACLRAGRAPSLASTARSIARGPSMVRPTSRAPSGARAEARTLSGRNTASGGATRVAA